MESKTRVNILIVDDEEVARYGMRKALDVRGRVFEAANLTAARKICQEEQPAVVLLDLNLGSENGFDLLGDLGARDDPPQVVVITAHGNEKIAVEAMKEGAFDYLAKPFDLDELRLIVRNALRQIELREENRDLREKLAAASSYGEIIGSGEEMSRLFGLMEQIADTDVTVLIVGESGTGKELVARELHCRSPRSQGPLITVNCAAIPENLIESELFGSEKGAFTGATQRRAGKFEQARGGTLFLDEIGEMALETQAKILRALEERVVQRVGGNDSIAVDVRIISATHADLRELVKQGQFREDLYYRLEVVRLEVPPLRRRREDVPALVSYFLKLFARKHDRAVPELAEGILARLAGYPFPGNVRELRNMMERLVVLNTTGVIGEHDLPDEVRFYVPSAGVSTSGLSFEPFLELDFRTAREEFEKKYLLWKLREHDNNITHTADSIGIHRQSLQQKIRDLGLREFLD